MEDRQAKGPSSYFTELGDEGEDLTLHGDLFKVEPLKEVGQKVSLVHQVWSIEESGTQLEDNTAQWATANIQQWVIWMVNINAINIPIT